MYIDYDCSLEEWLDKVGNVASDIIHDYEADMAEAKANTTDGQQTKDLPYKAGDVIEWAISKLGEEGLVGHPEHLTQETYSYLIPVKQLRPFLDTDSRRWHLCPVIFNPTTMHDASVRLSAQLGIRQPTPAEPSTAEPSTAEPSTAEPSTAELTTVQPATVQPATERATVTNATKAFSDAAISALRSGKAQVARQETSSLEEDSDFEVDVKGSDAALDQWEVPSLSTSASEDSHDDEGAEETLTPKVTHADGNVEQENATPRITSKADIKAFLKNKAGFSVLGGVTAEETPASEKKFNSFTSLHKRRSQPVATMKVATAIRETVNKDPTERQSLNDSKEKRRAERLRKENELDDFFGMKRQQITPEIRQELQALDLRGFVDPKQRYRGAKRKLELADAASGFFRIGQVVAGGLNDRAIAADGSTHITGDGSKTKKVKSLVKSILLQK